MNCNLEIHNELDEMGELNCTFCYLQLQDHTVKYESCCKNMELENNNGVYICVNCGQADRYDMVNEYIDFYENNYRIRRKSVYHRKYHIENIILTIIKVNVVYMLHLIKKIRYA